MTVDEYSGMIKAYKNIKDYCNQLSRIGKDESVVTKTMHTILDSVQKYCDSSIAIVEENIDGEMQRMYEMMEGKKDDREDHRDV
tara:strand:+ start:701 stop:952 length:252 start_codon:yes stop_codon:yes gene_type:complete